MNPGLMMRWTLAMVGVMTLVVPHAYGVGPDDTRPFQVRVVDAQQKGIPNLALVLTTPDQPRRTFTTDKEGQVTIPAGVAVEGAILSAASGHDALAWAQAGDPNQSFHDGTQGIPIVMKLLPLTRRVEGSVVDREGKPIAGVRLGVQSLFHPTNRLMVQDLDAKDPLLGFVVTDNAGKFVVTLPSATRARIRAIHPRYIGPLVEVSETAQTLSPMKLMPAGGIVGKLTDASTGKPVAGASVAAQLIERQPPILSEGWGQSVTDDQGRFTVGGLDPGVYNLFLIEVPGRPHATAIAVEGVRVAVGSDATADLAVVDGRPIRGVVVDRVTGRTIAGAQVGCQGSAVPQSGLAIMGTKTDSKGRFTFHVPPGEQFVYLIDDTQSKRMSRRVVVVPDQDEVIPLCLLQPPPPSTVSIVNVEARPALAAAEAPPAISFARTVVMAIATAPPPPTAPRAAQPTDPKSRTLTGHVRDAKGRPLPGIRIGYRVGPARVEDDRETSALAATDREGAFILRGVPPGPVSIILARTQSPNQAEAVPADRDVVDLTYRIPTSNDLRNRVAVVEDEPIPAEMKPRLTFVDLTPYGTNYLADGPAPASDGNNLDRLPRGVQKLADTYFRIGEKIVQVKGQNAVAWPESVNGIKVGAKCAKLQILQGNEQQNQPGTELGNYVIHYADGSLVKIPIVYGRNVVDWWHSPARETEASTARIAWKGSNEMVDGRKVEKLELRLYAFTWTNPHPDKEITTIDMVSSNTACDPYLIAVTLERDK